MERYAISRAQLEVVCLGGIRHRLRRVRAVQIVPADPRQPPGNWELFSVDPMPGPAALDMIMEVIHDLQAVFCLKPGV